MQLVSYAVAIGLSIVLVASLAAPVGAMVGAGHDAEIDGLNSAETGQEVSLPQQQSPVGACFPGDGYELTIGSEGPQIDAIVHYSLLTNLGAPGSVGIEMAGTTGSQYIITLRTGVLFEGVGDAQSFVTDPVSQFSVAFEFDFSLPMFAGVTGGDFDYNSDEAPIDRPIGDAVCESSTA